MKNILFLPLAITGLALASANAATLVWTGAGANSNTLGATDNWLGAIAPESSGNKIGALIANAGDLISFNSETATAMPTTTIDLIRISSAPTALPNFELLNGTLNFSRAANQSHAGTTFTIGDGNLTTAAQANFNTGSATINLGTTYAGKTYILNADGTLQIAADFTWGSTNDVVANLMGGSINSGGAVTDGLVSRSSNFLSFQSLGSTFTANFGGEFLNEAAVLAEFTDSFRLGGALASNGSSLNFTDNLDGSFTVGAVPEPSTALLGAIGLLALLRRRR